jgi:hypothetical protein
VPPTFFAPATRLSASRRGLEARNAFHHFLVGLRFERCPQTVEGGLGAQVLERGFTRERAGPAVPAAIPPSLTTLNRRLSPPRQQGVDGEEAKTGTPSWS